MFTGRGKSVLQVALLTRQRHECLCPALASGLHERRASVGSPTHGEGRLRAAVQDLGLRCSGLQRQSRLTAV